MTECRAFAGNFLFFCFFVFNVMEHESSLYRKLSLRAHWIWNKP